MQFFRAVGVIIFTNHFMYHKVPVTSTRIYNSFVPNSRNYDYPKLQRGRGFGYNEAISSKFIPSLFIFTSLELNISGRNQGRKGGRNRRPQTAFEHIRF